MEKANHPWIIAHRGARDEAPENTMSALRQALRYPIEGIEFDVQMSLDGVPLLYHDRTLAKVGGGRRRVSDATSADLNKIDWGGWFHSRFSGEPLTTLQETMSLLENCPNLCIEIKSLPTDQADGRIYQLTERVLEIVNQPHLRYFKDRILILSFDPQVLIHGHQLDGGLRYVLNIPEKGPKATPPKAAHLFAVGVRIGKLSAPLAQWARKQRLRLFTYTCNGPRQVNKALKLGVDAIITDRPAWLARRLGRFQ